MNTGFEDSLKQLKLEDGVGGVQKLQPHKRIAKEFTTVLDDEHLHIVVECLRTGEFQRLIFITAVLIGRPFTLPSPTLLMCPRLS